MKANKQVWLSAKNGKEKLQLPVNPEQVEFSTGSQTSTVNIQGLGDVSIIDATPLTSISLSSEFPAQYAPYCEYVNIPAPRDAVATIEGWRDQKIPVRFFVTKTPWNFAVTIEDFTYHEAAGDVDTIVFSLQLQVYRFVKVRKMEKTTTSTGAQKAAAKKGTARPDTKVQSKTYKVVKGDSLYKIAQKYKTTWQTLADINKLKAPYTLQIGQVIKLP